MQNASASSLPIARRPYTEPLARHDLNRMDVPCPSCQALHWLDERLASSSAASPKFGFCCYQGRVHLPPLEPPPYSLQRLYDARTPQAKEFRQNIRQYNAALAFTSLGAKIDDSVLHGSGPYVFRIHGELCHLAGSLLAPPEHQPQYSQLYIHDPQYALQCRMQRNDGLRRDTMDLLQRVISVNHAYAEVYRHAHEILLEHPAPENISLRLHFDSAEQDRRRYNLPTADEIAVVIVDEGEQVTAGRDIILRARSGELQRIREGHQAYACLHYVLLFPHGEHGWHYNL
ncbi:hypothetical protein BC629DRAFT_1642421, partial [Irpex lacteus]